MVLNDAKLYATSSGLALAILVLVAVLLQGPAQATSLNGEVASDVLYHDATGSYFQVVRVPNMGWYDARVAAGRKTYEGRRGRLAKIDSPAVHSFIARELKFNGRAHIGLRYVCSTRELMWLDGSGQQNGFAPWSRVWYRTVDSCIRSGHPFMAVSLTSGMRWQAQTPIKHLNYYIVEYPSENAE